MTPQDQIIARSRIEHDRIAAVADGRQRPPAGIGILEYIASLSRIAARQCEAATHSEAM